MYRAPSGAELSEAQRAPFAALVRELVATRFDLATLVPRLPAFARAMRRLCATEDDGGRLVAELDGWVRWYRLPGYYLAFALQAAMQATGSGTFVAACALFADAQTHCAEDLSLTSLENAYVALASLGADDPAFAPLTAGVLLRLKATYRYYRQWYSATPYTQIDQLAESLYFDKTWRDLVVAFPGLLSAPDAAHVSDALQAVVDRCPDAADAFCRVVALRHLGLHHSGAGDFVRARDVYRTALHAAREAGLDAEVGHLHRLLGHALLRDGQRDEAELEYRRAFTHDAHPKFAYWQALSLCELGDARIRAFSPDVDPAAPPPELRVAYDAYADGRRAFETHVGRDVLPIARAVEQQMFRSYADNAVALAMLTGPEAFITAIEAFGPRYATDVVAESRAAGTLDAADYARYRRARATVHQTLAAPDAQSVDAGFETYRDDVLAQRSERRYYFATRNALAATIAAAQSSEHVFERLRALRVPATVFLAFEAGRAQLRAAAVDASTGKVVFGGSAGLDRDEWEARHAAFSATAARASRLIDPAVAMRDALDELGAFYQSTLGALLDGLAPAVAGKHLKLFPRYLMNAMPLHALHAGGRRLVEFCDVSYAPSLSLLLQIHEPAAVQEPGTLAILRDAARTPAYAGTLASIAARSGATASVVTDASWHGFQSAVTTQAPSDIFFACHGQFDADDPKRSRLFVTANEPVPFTQMFADLDLRGCRSVLMGACESGIGRTLVSAEYIGLPLAFLAAGVRYCIGTLWQVNQISSAILVATFYALLHAGGRSVANCLAEAIRTLMVLSRADAIAWLREFLPEKAAAWEATLRKLDDPPYAHPYYWAGFYLTGDV